MSKKSAAHEAKIEHCVKTLLRLPMLTVPEAMILAKFSQKDVADNSLRRLITRRLPGGTKGSIEWDSSLTPSTLSPLTNEDNPTASAGASMSIDSRIGQDAWTNLCCDRGRSSHIKRHLQRTYPEV